MDRTSPTERVVFAPHFPPDDRELFGGHTVGRTRVMARDFTAAASVKT